MNLFELFVKIGVKDEASGNLKSIGQKLGNGLKTAAKVGTAAVGVASAAIAALTTQAVNSFAEYEQLAGGAQKIFDQMDYSKIATDANNAYKELGLSANQYLAVINDVGATFAATMGDEAGYEAAKTGLKAISDYASGTGKNVDELSQKFTLITRSTSSYQSIADQFSGILPATSAGFLEQAQAAGILSDKYTQLTQVPIDEYQAAVSQMLQQGVADLGLAGNTAAEAMSTISGSLAMTKSAWSNLVTGLADENANLDMLMSNFVESFMAAANNIIPQVSVALTSASSLIQTMLPSLLENIVAMLNENLPILAEAAIGIIQSLVDGISQNQEMLMTTAMETITYLANSLISMLPQIVQLGLDVLVSLASGIASSIPTLIPTIVDVILQIVETLTNPDTLGQLMDAALAIIMALSESLLNPDTLNQLIEAAVNMITNLCTFLVENLDPLLQAAIDIIMALVSYLISPEGLSTLGGAAVQIIGALASALIGAVGTLLEAGGQLISELFTAFTENDWGEIGSNIIAGIKTGIETAWTNLKEWFTGLFGDLIAIAKQILGIASPSKVFKKIGGFTAEGFGVGFEDEFAHVKDDMEDALNFDDASVGINASIRKVGAGVAGMAYGGVSFGDVIIEVNGDRYRDEEALADALAERLQQMTDRRVAAYA